MCKWQIDDPEAQVKSLLSDCTWLEDLSMDLSSRHLRTYEAKRTEEQLYSFTFILFPSHFFSLSFFLLPFFCLFSFSSRHFSFFFHIIFFCFSDLLQHNTYSAFVRDDVMTPPPSLNDAHPQA
jgi:hypothetical protein